MPVMANCTFANNVGGGGGTGGVIGVGTAGGTTGTLKMRNIVIRGSGVQLRMPSVGTALYKNCAVPSATLTNWTSIAGTLTDEGGHVTTDPLLVDEDGADNVAGTVDDDLELQSGSPCVNAARSWGYVRTTWTRSEAGCTAG